GGSGWRGLRRVSRCASVISRHRLLYPCSLSTSSVRCTGAHPPAGGGRNRDLFSEEARGWPWPPVRGTELLAAELLWPLAAGAGCVPGVPPGEFAFNSSPSRVREGGRGVGSSLPAGEKKASGRLSSPRLRVSSTPVMGRRLAAAQAWAKAMAP